MGTLIVILHVVVCLTLIGIVPADLGLGVELSPAGTVGRERCIELVVKELAAAGVRPTARWQAVAETV